VATVRELINDSLALIGVLADGETATASEQASALRSLNRMMGRWSSENLLIHAKVRETFTLTSGQQSYSMGSGGDFNTTRPMRIEHAGIVESGGSSEIPISILNLEEWALITVKTTQSSFPTGLYAEGTYPTETIKVWPVPNTGCTLVLYSWKPLSSFASVNTDVSLPPGYEDAIVYNLAVRLAPEYEKEPSAALLLEADESKGNIKRMNIQPQYMSCDAAVLSRSGPFNIYTGE
jgi:hypothetical protein